MTAARAPLLLLVSTFCAGVALAQDEPAQALPAGHEPAVTLKLDPARSVRTGELLRVHVEADAKLGDDVTIAEQSLAPFEVHSKRARVVPPAGDRQRFVFDLALLAFEPGEVSLPALTLRVVTKDGFVGSVSTKPAPYTIRAWLGNEPNAQPRLETKPVVVMQDNYLPLYVAGAVAGAALVSLLTMLAMRYLRRRKARALPPPPPRPPWEIAIEKLAELRKNKARMIEEGKGTVFVDQASDVVREYLGASYAFYGLETTTDEMLTELRAHGAPLAVVQAVSVFLGRCDLVKFAKVDPTAAEIDALFQSAHELVAGGAKA